MMSQQVQVNNTLENKLRDIRARLSEKRRLYEEAVTRYALKIPLDKFWQSQMARDIERALIFDESIFFIVYGGLRLGKTSYTMKSLAYLLQTWDWEVIKEFTVFTPEEFKDKARRPLKEDFKYPMLVVEDAGIMLHNLDFNDPILKDFQKYLNVAGTNYASIVFTTPLPTYLIKKVRDLPKCTSIRIDKINNNPSKPRHAVGYDQWMLPDMKKTRVNPSIDDTFHAIMPTPFFEKYQAYRKNYTTQAFEQLEKDLYADAQEKLKKEHQMSKGFTTNRKVMHSAEPQYEEVDEELISDDEE